MPKQKEREGNSEGLEQRNSGTIANSSIFQKCSNRFSVVREGYLYRLTYYNISEIPLRRTWRSRVHSGGFW
jgi:hypothetical protein